MYIQSQHEALGLILRPKNPNKLELAPSAHFMLSVAGCSYILEDSSSLPTILFSLCRAF